MEVLSYSNLSATLRLIHQRINLKEMIVTLTNQTRNAGTACALMICIVNKALRPKARYETNE